MDALVAVVDDDPHFLGLIEVLLSSHGYRVAKHPTPESLRAADTDPLVVILDWQLGDLDGLELLPELSAELPGVPFVMSTAHPSPDLAIRAVRAGAFDFLAKPLDEARLIATLNAAVRHGELQRQVHADEEGIVFEGILARSPQMRGVFKVIENVAPTPVSVMITGESGTGKELIARAIHARSPRKSGPFVALNMAAIPSELVESTLFGHERGAFSGANQMRKGAAGEAHGGTLFLDELGEMPLELQSKLLRFLQERVYRRVGGQKDLESDVRIVSATNRDPLQAVREGLLREDLYYRLNVVPLQLPALREREEDVGLLATHFLQRAAERYGRDLREIAPGALERLSQHSWPGNVRELEHMMQRLVITEQGPRLEARMLSFLDGGVAPASPASAEAAASAAPEPSAAAALPSAAPSSPIQQTPPWGDEVIPLQELEKLAIAHALGKCGGSRKEAAARLGISQATIYRKLKTYGLG